MIERGSKAFLGLTLLAFLAALAYHALLRPPPDLVARERAALSKVLPGADRFEAKDERGLYEGIRKSDGATVGFVFSTADVEHGVRGYGDEIQLLVGLSPAGVIKGVEVLHHQETPGFFRKVLNAKYLAQYTGKAYLHPFVRGPELDAVTGATVSSTAIMDTLNGCGHAVAVKALALKGASFPETTRPSALLLHAKAHAWPLAILWLAFALGLLAWKTADWRLWLLQAAFVAYGLGFHHKAFLSILHFFAAAFVSPQAVLANSLTLSFLIAFFLVGLVIPRFFCGYLCPYGALQRLIHGATGRKGELPAWFRHGKRVLLLLLLVVFVVTLRQAYVDLEPFIVLFNQNFTEVNAAYLIFLLAASFFFAHFWCHGFCPLGAVGGAFGAVAWKRKKINSDCIDCGACIKACPHHALDRNEEGTLRFDPSECFSCQECRRSCPKNALSL